jgi:uncharacterized protein YjaZ
MTQVGYYFLYIIQLQQARYEMKEQILASLPETVFEDIILEDNQTAISWEEKGKEFYYHNELYDVAKIKTVNGKTHLLCVSDSKETRLMEQCEKALHGSGDQKNGKNTLKFQFPVYTLNALTAAFKNTGGDIKFPSVLLAGLHTAFLDVSAPPPKA